MVKTGGNSGLADYFWKTTCFWKETPLPWKIPFSLYSNTHPYLYIILNSLRSKAESSQLREASICQEQKEAGLGKEDTPESLRGNFLFSRLSGKEQGWGLRLKATHTPALLPWRAQEPAAAGAPPVGWAEILCPEGLRVGMLWALVGRATPTGICLTKHMTMR